MYVLAWAEGVYQLFLKLFPIQFTWKKQKAFRSWFQRNEGQAGEKELKGVTFSISQVLLQTGQCSENSGKQLQGFPIRQAAAFNNINEQGGKFSQCVAWQLASLGEDAACKSLGSAWENSTHTSKPSPKPRKGQYFLQRYIPLTEEFSPKTSVSYGLL